MASPLIRMKDVLAELDGPTCPVVAFDKDDLRKLIALADEVQAARMKLPQDVYDAWYELARDDITRPEPAP